MFKFMNFLRKVVQILEVAVQTIKALLTAVSSSQSQEKAA
jgi:hypothetical protein